MEHGLDTELIEHAGNEVKFAHRHAATEYEDVVGFEVKLEAAPKLGHIVQQMIVSHPLESVFPQCSDNRVRIGATDLMRKDGLSGLYQLVAC